MGEGISIGTGNPMLVTVNDDILGIHQSELDVDVTKIADIKIDFKADDEIEENHHDDPLLLGHLLGIDVDIAENRKHGTDDVDEEEESIERVVSQIDAGIDMDLDGEGDDHHRHDDHDHGDDGNVILDLDDGAKKEELEAVLPHGISQGCLIGRKLLVRKRRGIDGRIGIAPEVDAGTIDFFLFLLLDVLIILFHGT